MGAKALQPDLEREKTMIDTTYHKKPTENLSGVTLLDAILRGSVFLGHWLVEHKKYETATQRLEDMDAVWLMWTLAEQADEKLKEKNDDL